MSIAPGAGLERRFTLSPGPALALEVGATGPEGDPAGLAVTTGAAREGTRVVFAAEARSARLVHRFARPTRPLRVAAAIDDEDDAFARHDCHTCHNERERVVGPAWSEIALRHAGANRRVTIDRLARRIREGARVVLRGPVNAGKSSVFNMLLESARAIVTDEPGTTRDLIEETLVLRGLPVVLCDAAGLRESDSAAEREGVVRARRAAGGADLVLEVYDASREDRPEPDSAEGGPPAKRRRQASIAARSTVSPAYHDASRSASRTCHASSACSVRCLGCTTPT